MKVPVIYSVIVSFILTSLSPTMLKASEIVLPVPGTGAMFFLVEILQGSPNFLALYFSVMNNLKQPQPLRLCHF